MILVNLRCWSCCSCLCVHAPQGLLYLHVVWRRRGVSLAMQFLLFTQSWFCIRLLPMTLREPDEDVCCCRQGSCSCQSERRPAAEIGFVPTQAGPATVPANTVHVLPFDGTTSSQTGAESSRIEGCNLPCVSTLCAEMGHENHVVEVQPGTELLQAMLLLQVKSWRGRGHLKPARSASAPPRAGPKKLPICDAA